MDDGVNVRRDGDPAIERLSVTAVMKALPYRVCVVDTGLRILFCDWTWLRGAAQAHTSSSPPLGACLLDHLDEPERGRIEGVARNLLAMAAMRGPMAWEQLEITDHTQSPARTLDVCASAIIGSDGQPAGVLLSAWSGADDEAADREREAARLDVARQLAATLNHEINNPLFVISATLEDLLAESGDPATERRIHAALDAVWRVSSSVKQLSEVRQLITTAYISGRPMIDLEASQHPPAAGTGEGP